MDNSYEGFYAHFETTSKKEGSLLAGADYLVGDEFSIEFKYEDGRSTAWLTNKFGATTGFLDAEGSRRLQLAMARGLEARALLSFVAYSDMPEPGLYWGEFAVICFNPAYAEEMEAFVKRIAQKLGEGVRPNIDLRGKTVARIFDEEGWVPADNVPLPKKEAGMAILKDSLSMSEKVIEQGRAGNKGCYVVSILFIIAVVLGVAYLIAHLFGVL